MSRKQILNPFKSGDKVEAKESSFFHDNSGISVLFWRSYLHFQTFSSRLNRNERIQSVSYTFLLKKRPDFCEEGEGKIQTDS